MPAKPYVARVWGVVHHRQPCPFVASKDMLPLKCNTNLTISALGERARRSWPSPVKKE